MGKSSLIPGLLYYKYKIWLSYLISLFLFILIVVYYFLIPIPNHQFTNTKIKNLDLSRHHHLSNSFPYDNALIVSFIVLNNNPQCIDNTLYFIDQSLVSHKNVEFKFSSFEPIHDNIKKLLHSYIEKFNLTNVHLDNHIYSHLHNLQLHYHQISKSLLFSNTSFSIILSCDVRGPFHYRNNTNVTSMLWFDPLYKHLTSNKQLVSLTISCERQLHIQSYFLAMNYLSVLIIHELTKTNSIQTMKDLEIDIEITKQLRSHGIQFTSLAYTYDIEKNICDLHYTNETSKLMDPFSCIDGISIGCRGIDPCEVLFVQYNEKHSPFLANYTRDRIELDAVNPNFCYEDFVPMRQAVDYDEIIRNITFYKPWDVIRHKLNDILVHEIALIIVVRVHKSYLYELISLLWFLHSSKINILVVILPTENNVAIEALNLINQGFMNIVGHDTNLFILPLDFPDWIYFNSESAKLIDKLCTKTWKNQMIDHQIYTIERISRICDINSPLHYFLVNLALYYINQISFKRKSIHVHKDVKIIFTNADNYISQAYLHHLVSSELIAYDLVISQTVSRGNLVYFSHSIGGIDLVSMAWKLDFLYSHEVDFDTALPRRPQADDYHDNDGYLFLFVLENFNVLMKVMDKYYVMHN